MLRKKMVSCLAAAVFALCTGCGRDLPFDYQYRSARSVEIRYQGKTYVLNQFGPRTPAPFDYAFEPDGDVDIRINGKVYDIDSPYDVDKPKKRTTKKTSSKKKRRKKNRT